VCLGRKLVFRGGIVKLVVSDIDDNISTLLNFMIIVRYGVLKGAGEGGD